MPWLRKPAHQKPEHDDKTKAGTSLPQYQARKSPTLPNYMDLIAENRNVMPSELISQT